MGLFTNKENQKQRDFEAEQAQINRQFQHDEAQIAYERQQSLNAVQNTWNIEQWNRENRYNSASEQVKRLREAGLNPAMHQLDGAGEASHLESADSAVPAVPSGSSAHGTAGSPPSGFEKLLQSLTFARDAWELRQQIQESKSRIQVSQNLLPYQIGALEADAKNKIQNALELQYKRPHMIENLRKQNQYITQQIGETAANERLLRAQVGRVSQLTGAEYKKLLSDAYQATQSGNWDKFRTEYTRKHGITPENSNWLQKLMQTAMENPKEAENMISSLIDSSDKVLRTGTEKVGQNLFQLFKSIPNKLSNYFGLNLPFSWKNPF